MSYKNTPKETFKDVTIEDVKKCKGFENISNELAQKIADAIRVYTEIIYNCYVDKKFTEQQTNCNNKQHK